MASHARAFSAALIAATLLLGLQAHVGAAAQDRTAESPLSSAAARAGIGATRFPDMGAARPIALTDVVTGRPLLPYLQGKVTLVSFVAATCEEECPKTEATFGAVQRLLQEAGYLGSRTQLVLVTIDPVEDTPPRLRALAAKIGAQAGSFHVVTGPVRKVEALLKAYGIVVTYHRGSYVDPDHTVATYLIDPTWHIRYAFNPFYPPSAIARLAERLASSTQQANGVVSKVERR